jgi:Tfp pilus assembly protein PilF
MRNLLLILVIAVLMAPLAGCTRSQQNDEAGEQNTSGENSAELYARGEEAYMAGRHDEALALLQQVPAQSPESARAHNLIGLIHARRGNTALAALEFKAALAADPRMASAHNNLGVLYAQEGRLELAQTAFQAAVNADPYYVAPHQGLAEVYYKMGKTEDAKAELKLVNELQNTQQGSATASIQDLDMGQRLDVAELIERERRTERPSSPRPAAPKRKPASKPAPASQPTQAPAPQTVTARVAAPAGTVMTIALDEPISSATAQVGQEVRAHVVGDVTVGQETLVRNGAAVKGKVTEAESSGRVKGRATLALGFTSVETTDGWRDIEAHMVDGTLKAPGTKKRDAATIGIGAAAGAVLGEILGDKAKTGAIIGGAAGTAVVLSTKGKEVELEPGTQLGLELDQELAVTITKTAPVTE